MAQTFKFNAGQSYQIPDVGEIFKDTQGVTYKYLNPTTIVTLAREVKPQADFSTLGNINTYNMGDVLQGISQQYRVDPNRISTETSDINLFKNYVPPTSTGNIIDKTFNALGGVPSNLVNPNPVMGTPITSPYTMATAGTGIPATPQTTTPTISAPILTSEQLNAIAKSSGYTGGTFSNVGLTPEQQKITNALTTGTSGGAIPVSGLSEKVNQYNLPTPTLTTNTIIPGAMAYDQQVKNAQLTENNVQAKYDVLSNEIQNLIGTVPSKSEIQLTAENQANLPALTAQLADINGQISTKLAAYKALTANIEGKPITMNSIIGSEAQIKNVAASEIGLLQATAQALQGRITDAQNTVNRAVDLKYQAPLDLINLKLSQLNLIKDDLTAKEKITANLLDKKYKEQQLALSTSIANEKDKNAILLNQMQSYPDAGITLSDTLEQANSKIVNNSKIYKKNVGNQVGLTRGLSSNAEAVIKNPNLLNSFTATVKGQVIGELQTSGYDTSNLGVKPLSDTAIKEINQTDFALTSLNDLKTIINDNLEYVGPISGFSALNPWSKARQVQADIDRVRQTVGKALEGGVLRKEDEEKYKKILATITDTPETATYKLNQLINSIQNNLTDYKLLQTNAGRSSDVSTPLNKSGTVITGTTSGNNSYTIIKE